MKKLFLLFAAMCCTVMMHAKIVYHAKCDPTNTNVGYTQECWEDMNSGKIYANEGCTQELNPAHVVTYKMLISDPVITNTGLTLMEENTHDGVKFNWVAETTYNQYDTETRYVEFGVYGNDVANARLKWWKDYGSPGYGKFFINVYVNGESVYSVNQDDESYLNGLFTVPLQGLKHGDIVRFEVYKNEISRYEGIASMGACLEYTSSNGGGGREVIYNEAKDPTYETTGNIEYWEDKTFGKYYSNYESKREINPAQVVTYAKFKNRPIITNNGFTLKEEATCDNIRFNWAAETTYNTNDTGTRSVEFYVYGEDVANARIKWWKNTPEPRYGKFAITVYVNGTSVYSVNQDGNKPLGGLFAVSLPNLKTGDKVKFEIHKANNSEQEGYATIAACLEYTSSNGGKIEVLHHSAVNPTYETIGNIEYWEDVAICKYYSDAECTQELNPAQVFLYKKLKSNPVATNNGYTLKEEATYDDVPFNWAAETTYNTYDTGTRSVEFYVFGKEVGNARIRWWKGSPNWQYGKFTITIYVNGTSVYSVNQDDNKYLSGLFDIPLPDLKTGDKVRFEVYKNQNSEWAGNATIAACLEYTSSDGGEKEIIHHKTVEPTYETTGSIEYWEDKLFGKYYFDANCTRELNPTQIETQLVTYKKFKSNPIRSNNGFTLKEEATYDDVPFNWTAETKYDNNVTGNRSVEFYVYGKDVANARLKWWKNAPDYRYGQFTITIYVNGESVYSVNQDDRKSLSGFVFVPLSNLKTGDKVKFEVYKKLGSDWPGTVTMAACLEYTSKNGGKIECLYHEAVNPTNQTIGYSQECWEDEVFGKYYSDAECTQELNPAQVISYKKFISNPVITNNGFTLKENATYDEIPFNWAAETQYGTFDKGIRSVEFGVYGEDVADARLKWWKDAPDYGYGKFTITIYVNGESVYSVNQDDGKSLGGLFAIPFPNLKTGDIVKFEVQKDENSKWDGTATISACLEYTNSDGAERKITHKDAVEATYKTVGNIEYWKDETLDKYYFDSECTHELGSAQVVTYKKFLSNPVVTNTGYTLKEEATYDNIPFNWAAETSYNQEDTGIRTIEFHVFGKDVANARLRCWKDVSSYIYGQFFITIYVNGESVYSVNQEGGKDLGGLFAVSLPNLKTGDKVEFEVKKYNRSSLIGTTTIAACLEYTSSDGSEREIIHHEAVEPTYESVGNIEYWEDELFDKYYSDAKCIQEINSAQVFKYKKLISTPVITNNGFTLKEEAIFDEIQFDWAAEATYDTYDYGTSSVEFYVYGKDVGNARLKWWKPNPKYGKFTITISVNGESVLFIDKDDYKYMEGLFATPLSNLKTGDIVKFTVSKNESSEWAGAATIAACLEYTSSNGGNGMLVTANQDPDKKENYYSTFYSSVCDYQVSKGVTAYTGVVDGNVLKLTSVADGIIPAGEAVILKLTSEDKTATKQHFALIATTTTATKSSTNALTGTDVAKTLGANDYALSLGQYGVGFYLWDGNTIGANKAYLELTSQAKAFTFQFEDGEVDAIQNCQLSTVNSQLYNLNGVRVNEGYKGLVIKNGKKIYQR